MSGVKGPADLEREVLKQKLCTACGACLGLCPYFSTFQGRVVMTDSCSSPEGALPRLLPPDINRYEEASFHILPGRSFYSRNRAIPWPLSDPGF